MAIDWDEMVLNPVMGLFGEGQSSDTGTLPVYTPAGSVPFALRDAVFDVAYRDVELPEDDVTSVRPVLGVRAVLFDRPPRQGDTVYIPSNGKLYGVADVRPDGHGHIKLMLIEAA